MKERDWRGGRSGGTEEEEVVPAMVDEVAVVNA